MTDDKNLVVPFLRHGTGSTPKEGGCIMQVISWIANPGDWRDDPPCVHPVLRKLAIKANDSLDDQRRQDLLALAPRLMNTATKDIEIAVKLGIFCARQVLHIFEQKYPDDNRPRKSIEAAENNPQVADAAADAATYAVASAADAAADAAAYAAKAVAYAAYAAANGANAAAYAAANAVAYAAYAADAAANAAAYAAAYAADEKVESDLLMACLDEYDRLTGRTVEDLEIDWTPVCKVMA